MTQTSSTGALMPMTRASAVADGIRRLILSGEWPPGTRLRQNELAERFGVSTTPVREAFTALSREGLVRHDAHRGVIVSAASVADVVENYTIRMALEALAAEAAASRISDTELDQLSALLVEMRDKMHSEPDEHRNVLNPRFHYVINAAARMPRLLEIIQPLRDTAHTYHSLIEARPVPQHYLDGVEREHAEIFRALKERDGKRAAEGVRIHIKNNLDQFLSQLPEKTSPIS